MYDSSKRSLMSQIPEDIAKTQEFKTMKPSSSKSIAENSILRKNTQADETHIFHAKRASQQIKTNQVSDYS